MLNMMMITTEIIIIINAPVMGLRGGGKRAGGGSTGPRGRGKTTENPFKEVKIIKVDQMHQPLFECAFINSVRYCSAEYIDSLQELKETSSETLESIMTYVKQDKARNSDKVYAISGMMKSIEQMEMVKTMIDSAIGHYRKLFAENLWEKCIINDEFDPAELRSFIRSAKERSKDSIHIIYVNNYIKV